MLGIEYLEIRGGDMEEAAEWLDYMADLEENFPWEEPDEPFDEER